MLTNIIPDTSRKVVYAVFALIAAAEGAMHTAYTTIGAADPKWLMIALAVTVYVGIAIGAVAASNVPSPAPAPAPMTLIVNTPSTPVTDTAATTPTAAPVAAPVAAVPGATDPADGTSIISTPAV
jgi:hypothetical protein